jgi:hypothetical protein
MRDFPIYKEDGFFIIENVLLYFKLEITESATHPRRLVGT